MQQSRMRMILYLPEHFVPGLRPQVVDLIECFIESFDRYPFDHDPLEYKGCLQNASQIHVHNGVRGEGAPNFYRHVTAIDRIEQVVNILRWNIVARCVGATPFERVRNVRSFQCVCGQHLRGQLTVLVDFIDPFVTVDHLRVERLSFERRFLRQKGGVAQIEWCRRWRQAIRYRFQISARNC